MKGSSACFEEMERSGLRDPLYDIGEANVELRFSNFLIPRDNGSLPSVDVLSNVQRLERRMGIGPARDLLKALMVNKLVSNRDIAEILMVTPPTARNYLRLLEQVGLVEMKARSATDPTTKWRVRESPLWDTVESYLKGFSFK